MPLIPIVIERSGREERAMDIYSRLLQDRIIMLGTAIDDNVANLVVAQMLVLAHQDDKADIHQFARSAFYAASQLAQNGPVVIAAFTWDNADQRWTGDNEAQKTLAKVGQAVVERWSPHGLDAAAFPWDDPLVASAQK